MFLFEECEKNIRIYNYLISEERLYHFKKEQMAKIPEDERVLKAITNYRHFPLEEKKKILAYSDLNYAICIKYGVRSSYHFLRPYEITEEEKDRQRKLLEDYYLFLRTYGSKYYMIYGKSNNACLADDKMPELKGQLTISSKGLFLIPTSNYKYVDDNNITMDNILNVPETLYFLESFLASDFKNIPEQYILEYLKLFAKPEMKDIDIDTYNMMVKYNLASREDLDKKIEDSHKVLKLIKSTK